MKTLVRIALLLYLLGLPTIADAATCFWVGGTGTWNNSTDTAFWKSTSGGGTACAATGGVPKNAGDIATFDGASGGGTITINVDVNIAQITAGAFTGTLDWSAHNNAVTLSTAFNGSGSGTRTINLGNGIWTFTATSGTPWQMTTTTGLTFNANSSTLVFTATTASTRTFQSGQLNYNIVTVSANSSGGAFLYVGGQTTATFNITAPNAVGFQGTTTLTNAPTWTGASGSLISLSSQALGTTATISVASGTSSNNFVGIRDLTFSGGAIFTAINCYDLGHNSGVTCTAPATGGGGRIIGGWLLRRDLYHNNDNNLAWLEKVA